MTVTDKEKLIMADDKKEAQYAPPTSQVDLEERLERGNKSNAILSTADDFEPPKDSGEGNDYRVEGNETDEYVGVDPIYATYANDTEAPLESDDSNPESEVFQTFAEGLNPQVPEGWQPKESEQEVTSVPADSADEENPDGEPVPQSGTTASTSGGANDPSKTPQGQRVQQGQSGSSGS